MRILPERIREMMFKMFMKCTDKLFKKLVLLFSSMIILVLLSSTLISYKIIEDESMKNIITSNTNNLKLVNKNFENYFEGIDQLSFPQLKFEPVMNALQDEAENYSSEAYLEDYIRSLYYSREDIQGIYLYLVERKKYYYITRQAVDTKVRVSYDAEIANQKWFRKVLENKNGKFIQSLVSSQETGYPIGKYECFMAYHRSLINISDRKCKAVISFYFNSLKKEEILKDIPLSKGEHVIFGDLNDIAFYMDNENYFQTLMDSKFFNYIKQEENGGLLDWKIGQDNYLAVYNISAIDKWKLIKLIPYNEIYKAAQTNRNLNFLVGCIFLFISILIVTLTSNAITKPLKKLSNKLDRFGEGDFDVEARVEGHDEIAQLSIKFNLMVKRINDLINEEYKMKLVEKSAILKALEAEINPHFLYNALQAISTKALKNGVNDISEMVDALASTFKYCISGQDIVKVSSEIKHVENYLVLQKARFGARLVVLYELDQQTLEIKIPKLSIQTLIENSIKHGLEKISTAITIVIKVGRSGQRILITVSDNGPGIKPEKLKGVLDSLTYNWENGENKSIGLKNLNTRLKLIYGDQSNINIKTDENGTEISFMIPEGAEA